jgi:hypothetical protein
MAWETRAFVLASGSTGAGTRWWSEERVDWYVDTGDPSLGLKLRGWTGESAAVVVELKVRRGAPDAQTAGERWHKALSCTARCTSSPPSSLDGVARAINDVLARNGSEDCRRAMISGPLRCLVRTAKRRLQWSEKLLDVGRCTVERTEIDIEVVRPAGDRVPVGTFRSSCVEGASRPAHFDVVARLLFESGEQGRGLCAAGPAVAMGFPAFVHEIVSSGTKRFLPP